MQRPFPRYLGTSLKMVVAVVATAWVVPCTTKSDRATASPGPGAHRSHCLSKSDRQRSTRAGADGQERAETRRKPYI